jgi:hypothetical protein
MMISSRYQTVIRAVKCKAAIASGDQKNVDDDIKKSATTSWGYEEGPWKGPGPPASIRFARIKHTLAVSVEPFKFSPVEPVAYELSYFMV